MTTFHDHGWRHDVGGGLTLVLGETATTVPFPLDEMLAGLDGVGLSPVPAVDVLRVESRLRHLVAVLEAELVGIERRVASIRLSVEDQAPALRLGRRDRRMLADRLLEAIEDHARITGQVRRARTYLVRLRDFVAASAPSSGWLREAADGWARGPEPPPGVTVFASDDHFMDADPRRATTTGWGGREICGFEKWGHSWRRDGDEDDPAAADDGLVHRDGPWSVGYIPRTRELYAIRRSGHLPRVVWGLGALDPASSASVSDLYVSIGHRMREPNSIVLVAERATELAMSTRTDPVCGSLTENTKPIGGQHV